MSKLVIKGIIYHPYVPRDTGQYAPLHHRYVGLYHWSTYWNHWDKIVDVEHGEWVVVAVDINGNPLPGIDGRVRRHRTMMEAAMFANKPFIVKSRYDKDVVIRY